MRGLRIGGINVGYEGLCIGHDEMGIGRCRMPEDALLIRISQLVAAQSRARD